MAVTDKIDHNKKFFTRRYFRHVCKNFDALASNNKRVQKSIITQITQDLANVIIYVIYFVALHLTFWDLY